MTKPIPLPSLEYLNECFELDSSCASGLRWKERPLYHFSSERIQRSTNSKFSGKEAGTFHKIRKHISVCIEEKRYCTHRIVYAMYHKTTNLPEHLVIDHINRNAFDNRPENLRLVTQRTNSHNRSLGENNRSGFANLHSYTSAKGIISYCVYFRINGKRTLFGRYQEFEKAKARVIEVSLELCGKYSPYYLDNK